MSQPDKVEAILSETYNVIKDFEIWSISEENGVKVLNGEEEGTLGWIAANMAAGNFNPGNTEKNLQGSLDMGGSSSQKVSI